MYPNDIEAVVPYHCDKWYNHSIDEINFWLPLHQVSSSESMQIVSLNKSVELEKKILKKFSYNKINKLISKYAKPVKCDYGKILKFSPLHLHGNVINKTKFPRISIDFRVKKLNSKFQSKTLGGILMLSENKVCSYVNNNTYFTKNIPQHLQRLMIEKFCKQEKLKISTELLEYNNIVIYLYYFTL